MPARRIQAEWTGLAGAPYLSTFYFVDGDPSTDQALADAVETLFDTATNIVSQSLRFTILPEVVRYSVPSQPTGVTTVVGATHTGDSSQGLASRATQGLIRLRTGQYRGAREVQGRIFIPGVTVQGLDGTTGNPSAAYQATLTAMGGSLVQLGLQVASRTADQFYPVVSAAAWNRFAVLRSRRD